METLQNTDAVLAALADEIAKTAHQQRLEGQHYNPQYLEDISRRITATLAARQQPVAATVTATDSKGNVLSEIDVAMLAASRAAPKVATDTSGTEAVAWPTREQVVAAVQDAMQDTWNDICLDTGCYPTDIRKEGRKLWFLAGQWAEYAGNFTYNALFTRSAPDGDGASREKGKGVSDER